MTTDGKDNRNTKEALGIFLDGQRYGLTGIYYVLPPSKARIAHRYEFN
jgi:hypothetical protein